MTRRMTALVAGMMMLGAAAAEAQTQASAGRSAPKRPREFVVGGLLAGPSSMGSADANLLGGGGSTSVTLFTVENRFAMGAGVEANIGFEIRKGLWAEISGGWTRASLTSRITDDFENADADAISSPMSRFLLEGAMLLYLRERGNTAWFLRVDGGWMRETAGGATLTGDGFIAGGGVGFRRWWRTNGKGAVKRMGFRAEGRAAVRSGGISLGGKSLRFGPAGAAHVVWGF